MSAGNRVRASEWYTGHSFPGTIRKTLPGGLIMIDITVYTNRVEGAS